MCVSGPIKQECRSQIRKTTLLEAELSPCPEGSWLKKKKIKPGFLSLPPSPSSPLPSPKSIPRGQAGSPGGSPGRRLIRCLHPICVLFVKAPFQQPGPLAALPRSELVSGGQSSPLSFHHRLPPVIPHSTCLLFQPLLFLLPGHTCGERWALGRSLGVHTVEWHLPSWARL